MSDFRRVTDTFSVSPQIDLADVARARAQGFGLLINNRPDGETAGQPLSAEVEAAARAAGLDYLHIPVTGRPGAEQAEAMRRAVDSAPGPVLAYCRSGTRSIITWALGRLAAGEATRGELLRAAEAAGYELSALLP